MVMNNGKRRPVPSYVRLNQHADKFGDKRTKRRRDRRTVKRKAIAESSDW